MSFIERELARIERALREPQSDEHYCQLYAAQQALAWALEPEGFARPSNVIAGGLVMPFTFSGTPAASGDCSADLHRFAS